MHLVPNELVYGVAPEILLDCARQLHLRDGRPFSLDEFCEALGAPVREALPVLYAMVADGFFQANAECSDRYSVTNKLAQLALANATNGLLRVEAKKLLERVIERAIKINADPEKHRCQVDCIVVFGSFLGDKEVLGDLDIGAELRELRPAGGRVSIDEVRRFMRGAASPTTKVMSALRLQKPKQISIHRLEEVLRLGTPFRVVFGDLPRRSDS